jgi:hypothetical protein
MPWASASGGMRCRSDGRAEKKYSELAEPNFFKKTRGPRREGGRKGCEDENLTLHGFLMLFLLLILLVLLIVMLVFECRTD